MARTEISRRSTRISTPRIRCASAQWSAWASRKSSATYAALFFGTVIAVGAILLMIYWSGNQTFQQPTIRRQKSKAKGRFWPAPAQQGKPPLAAIGRRA